MIETITITDWRQINDLEVDFPLEIFRGQANASWPLSSSIQRCLAETSWDDDIATTEFWFLREFRRKAKQYISDLPDSNDIISWMSIMQHHGTPTRLIDFSHSFYVACYFALIDARSDSAVWAIDPQWLLGIGQSVLDAKRGELKDEWEDNVYREANAMLNRLLATAGSASSIHLRSGAAYVQPFHSHQRLNTQQGLFVIPFDIQLSLLENLEPFVDKKSTPIRKIVLKADVRETGLAHLRAMNITSETLFPGIDGFAKSIIHKHLCM